jgi:GTP cyclohydrolase II
VSAIYLPLLSLRRDLLYLHRCRMPVLPSHASPILAPQPRPSAKYLGSWDQDGSSTPAVPAALISPAFTPPATPGASGTSTPLSLKSKLRHDDRREPKSFPVDTVNDAIYTKSKPPRLVERLPNVECVVRARIPTVISGTDMFLHLYQNDVDNKEHLAIVFGNKIRSQSLDRVREGETEMDRMIRGAYIGKLRPGRLSSWVDREGAPKRGERMKKNGRPDVGLGIVPEHAVPKGREESAPAQDPLQNDLVREEDEDDEGSDMSKPPLVRIHSECYTGETAWSARCDCGEQLDEAARLMSLHVGGVIVYLRQEGRGIGLSEKLKAYNLQDLGSDTVEANLLLRHPADARSYGLATAILLDLGCGGDHGIRLLTNNPDKVRAVEGPNREIIVRERVAMIPLAWRSGGEKGIHSKEIDQYLSTKIGKMGHMIND